MLNQIIICRTNPTPIFPSQVFALGPLPAVCVEGSEVWLALQLLLQLRGYLYLIRVLSALL